MNVVKTLIWVLLIFFSGKSLKLLMHLGMYVLFEFNSNSTAESDVNRFLQIRTCKWRETS